MNRFILLVTVLLFSCNQSDESPFKEYSIEDFMNTTSIGGSSFSHDLSRILYSSDQSGVFNVYSVHITTGKMTQLTQSDSSSKFAMTYFPGDDRFLFRGDQNGNEIWHIYLQEEDGSSRDLTPDEKARAVFYGWADDKESFFFGSNKRNPQFMDLYEMGLDSLKENLIYQNDDGLSFGAISNNKRYIALSKSITTNNSDIYLYDRNSAELKLITKHEGNVSNNPLSFDIQSKNLIYLSDEGSEFSYVKSYNIEENNSESMDRAEWDIRNAYFSKTGKYKVISINNDARTVIKVYRGDGGDEISLPEFPGSNITTINISDNEELMTFYVNGSKSPNNLYVYNFISREYKKLTNTLNPDINENHLVEAEVVRYKSFDGTEIPALFYRPKTLKTGQKIPALVKVHGGPGGQARIGYNASVQYMVNHGYAVIDVNNRGSSGYGKTFYAMDDQKHGVDDLQDCIYAKNFLASTGYVDTSKVAIWGGSYGGYMVLAALTFQPNAFAAGIDLFGISNWVRTLESIPPWWESFREALYTELGNPNTQKQMLYDKSPLFHATKIKKPLMVLQGATDPRVLKVESDEIVEAVKKNNVPVEYVLFEDEGHGFRKKKNRITANKAILDFANTHLKGIEITKKPDIEAN